MEGESGDSDIFSDSAASKWKQRMGPIVDKRAQARIGILKFPLDSKNIYGL
jgi:hypothetical protein